jgi:hypothetical protein
MIAPALWIPLLLFVLVVLTSFIRKKVRASRRVVTAFFTLIVAGAALCWHGDKAPNRPVEYETAARMCDVISGKFQRNQWLLISPFQELAYTYGQGWHLELSDFVSQFAPEQVAKPEFTFPYGALNVFIFVERRPLPVGAYPGRPGIWRYAPTESREWSSYLYGDPVGRASLEYRAADLVAAYAQSHKGVSVFYEDEDLVVYKLSGASTARES